VRFCALAVAIGAAELGTALGSFDSNADQNAARGYLNHLYADPHNILGRPKVFVDALAWMPEDATYAVITGPRMDVRGSLARPLASAYLRFLLLPRRRTEPASARWLFCYGCDVASLGGRFQVLSDGGQGILFGRLRR